MSTIAIQHPQQTLKWNNGYSLKAGRYNHEVPIVKGPYKIVEIIWKENYPKIRYFIRGRKEENASSSKKEYFSVSSPGTD